MSASLLVGNRPCSSRWLKSLSHPGCFHSTQPKANVPRIKGKIRATSTAGSTAVELFRWMEEHGAKNLRLDVQSIESGGNDIDRAVAKEELHPGDIAMSIPDNLIVTLDRVFQDESLAELLTSDKLSELACLTLYMMYEKKEGEESFWYPYIKELDRLRGRGQQGVESPLLWPKEQVEELFAGSPLVSELETRMEGIKKEYQECDTVWYLAGSLFNKYPYDIPTEAFSEEIFKQAFTAIQASVVHLQGVALSRRFALIPLGPPLTMYSSTSKAMLKYNPNSKSVDLVVDQDYKAGEPVMAWCGPQTNNRLLINYGIVDEDNPYDWIQITATLPTTDPLFSEKRLILLANGLATKQSFRFQRGKAIPVALLPFLRLAYETNINFISQVSFAEDAHFGDPNTEAIILHHLGSTLQSRINLYKKSWEEDENIIMTSTNPREVAASKLLRIEKEILNGALDEILEKPCAPERNALEAVGVRTSPVRLE